MIHRLFEGGGFILKSSVLNHRDFLLTCAFCFDCVLFVFGQKCSKQALAGNRKCLMWPNE